MARIRSIKPELWSSPSLMRVSRESRLCFIALISLADDAGRHEDIPRKLAPTLFPLDDDVTPEVIDSWINDLHAEELVERYVVGGRRFLQITGWERHQKVAHPSRYVFPAPDEADETREPHEGLMKGSGNSHDPVPYPLSPIPYPQSHACQEAETVPYEEIADILTSTGKAVVDANNGKLPTRLILNESAKKWIRSLHRDKHLMNGDLDNWREFAGCVAADDWLTGRDPKAEGWSVDTWRWFDKTKAAKVLERQPRKAKPSTCKPRSTNAVAPTEDYDAVAG